MKKKEVPKGMKRRSNNSVKRVNKCIALTERLIAPFIAG